MTSLLFTDHIGRWGGGYVIRQVVSNPLTECYFFKRKIAVKCPKAVININIIIFLFVIEIFFMDKGVG